MPNESGIHPVLHTCVIIGEGDKLKIFTFYFFLDLKIWIRSKPCQRRQKN